MDLASLNWMNLPPPFEGPCDHGPSRKAQVAEERVARRTMTLHDP